MKKKFFLRIITGCLYIIMLSLNVFLLLSICDTKIFIRQLEVRAGRDLIGYEPHSMHRAVNDYLFRDHPSRVFIIIMFGNFRIIWIALSLGISLYASLLLQHFRPFHYFPVATIVIMLSLIVVHWKYVTKILDTLE